MDINFSYEDIVGLLFLTLKKLGLNVNKVSFSLIEEYRNILFQSLIKKGYKPNHNFRRETKNEFLNNNVGIYRCDDDSDIVLEADLSVSDLTDKYVGYLNYDTIKILESEDFLNAVLDSYEDELTMTLNRQLGLIDRKRASLKKNKGVN